MDEKSLFDAIAQTDEELLDRAQSAGQGDPGKRKKRRILLYGCAAAVLAVLLALGALGVHLALKAEKTPETSSSPSAGAETSPISEPTAPANEISIQHGDYLIGAGQTVEVGQTYVIKALPTYKNVTIMMNANMIPEILGTYNSTRDRMETDPCLEIIGQWCSAVYAFDYERVFSLFTDQQVEKTLDACRQKHPQYADCSKAELIEELGKISKYFDFGDVDVTYTVTNVTDITEDFKEENRDAFAETGIDVSKITTALKYSFTDLSAVFFGKFDFQPDFPEMSFFEYEGRWYCNPTYLAMTKETFDMLADHGAYVSGEETVCGTVTEVRNGYAMVGGYLLLTNEDHALTVGETVEATVYKNAGLQVHMIGDTAWINVRTLISFRQASEGENGGYAPIID